MLFLFEIIERVYDDCDSNTTQHGRKIKLETGSNYKKLTIILRQSVCEGMKILE